MKEKFIPCDNPGKLLEQLNDREEMMRRAGRQQCLFEYPDNPLSYADYYDTVRTADGVALRFAGRPCLEVTPCEGGVSIASPNNMVDTERFSDVESLRSFISATTLGEDNVRAVSEATMGGCEVIYVMEDTRMADRTPICFVPEERFDIVRALMGHFGTFTTQDPERYDDVRLKLTSYIPRLTCRCEGAPFASYAMLYDGRRVMTMEERRRNIEKENYIPRMLILQTALAQPQASLVTSALAAVGCEYHCNMFFENAASLQMGRNSIDFYDSISSPKGASRGVEPVLSIYEDCTGHINVTDRVGWLSRPKPSFMGWKELEDMLNAPGEDTFSQGVWKTVNEISSRLLSEENIERASQDTALFIGRCELLDRAAQKAAGMDPAQGEVFYRSVELDIISQSEGRMEGTLEDLSRKHSLDHIGGREAEELNGRYADRKIKSHSF